VKDKSQKTLDKQTATFLGVLAQNIPQLSAEEMQYFIEHPAELRCRLEYLQKSIFIDEVICKYFPRLYDQLNFISPKPGWDFLIMQSEVYPEVGLSVSRRSSALGSGLFLSFKEFRFRGPCGCCPECWRDGPIGDSIQLITEACAQNGIKYLLLTCWVQNVPWDKKLILIDPMNPAEMRVLNKELFLQAFGAEGILYLKPKDNGYNPLPLSALFEI